MARKKRRILITCAGGSGPLYLAKRLRRTHDVFLVDGSEHTVAQFLDLPFFTVPSGSDRRYTKVLTQLIKKWRIDCIVPGADEELLPVARLCQQMPGIAGVLPRAEFIMLCSSKLKTSAALSSLNISRLTSFDSSAVDEVRYPAIVKPTVGRGSRGVHVVHSKKELTGYLDLYQKTMADLTIQPYIPGVEYTVSVIVNDRNALIGIVPKRVLVKRGITRAAVSEHHPIIERACQRIVTELEPHGPFNVQLKWWKKGVYIFEINPRLSTTSVLTERAFGNEVELYLRYLGAERIERPPQLTAGCFMYRYDEHLFR